MIEKKIRVIRDIDLNTYHGSYSLVKGEVKRVLFKNQNTFDDYLKIGNFVEADKNEPEAKSIPVILPEVTEDDIVRVEPVDKEDSLPTGEDIDEAGEPVDECTSEDLRRDEPSQTEEEIEEVVKEPVSEETLEDLNQTDAPQIEEEDKRAASEDTTMVDFEAQSVEEVPVEEIPIEEQGKTEPELGSGEVVE